MSDLLQTLLPLAQRMRANGFAFKAADGRLGVADRRLETADLVRHLSGEGARVGQYLIKPGESVCSVAALDLDSHDGEVTWEEMLGLSYSLSAALHRLGLYAHPFRSSGGHGLHLWLLWESPQHAHSVRALLQEVIGEFGYTDGSGGVGKKKIEIFPRQNSVDIGRYGNQVWLPLAGGSASVPLVDHPLNDGWIAGTREMAIGYQWKFSHAVPVLIAPPVREKKKVKTDDKDIRLLEGMLSVVVSDGYNYDLWISVGMSLHNATGGSDTGLDLWRNWSLDGPSDAELKYKWNSFKEDGKDRVTGIGTLKRLAGESGWIEPIDEYFEDLTGDGANSAITAEPLPPINPVIKNPNDHLAIARHIIASNYTKQETPCLIRSAASNDWFSWNGQCYERHLDEIVKNETRLFLDKSRKIVEIKPKGKAGRPKKAEGVGAAVNGDVPVDDTPQMVSVPFEPSKAQIESVLDALKTAAAPARGIAPAQPCWIGEKDKRALDYVSLKDGLLHLPTMTLGEHTPKYFTMNSLPYNWHGDGAGDGSEKLCPLWLKFLDETFTDQESRECLQEIVGYLIGGDTSLQKMFLIQGEPRSGKGTIARVIGALIGSANAAGTTLAQLGGEFGLWPLLDKSTVFISEARNTGNRHENISIAVERLLMISGEDALLINTKGGRYISATLRCRVFMTANDVPSLGDSSGAFASRFITLLAPTSKIGQEDEGLTDKLCTELPAILRWSLAGLDRLRARGKFVQPAAGLKVTNDLADAQNPVRRFVRDCCKKGNNERISKAVLYRNYKRWYDINGIGSKALSSNWFGNALRSSYREIVKKNLEEGRNRQEEYWAGISCEEISDEIYSPINYDSQNWV